MAVSIDGSNGIQSAFITEGSTHYSQAKAHIHGPLSVGSHTDPNTVSRVVLNWYQSPHLNSTNGSYYYIKTSVWAGGGPNNYEYIMGGFRIYGYQYTSPANAFIMMQFHNWSGSYYGYSVANHGDWTPDCSMVVSTDGYVTLKLQVPNQYTAYSIDLIQHRIYPVRDFKITYEGHTAP